MFPHRNFQLLSPRRDDRMPRFSYAHAVNVIRPVILWYHGIVKSNVSALLNTSHVLRESPFSPLLAPSSANSHNRRRKTVICRLSLSRLGGVYFIDDGPAGHGNIFRAFVSARYIGKSFSLSLPPLSLFLSLSLFFLFTLSFSLIAIAHRFVWQELPNEWEKYWNFEWWMPVLDSKINP